VNDGRRLADIFAMIQNGDTFCAGDDDCLAEANVFLYSSVEEGDVYMCAKHATEEMDRG
jgi:hypothetical protein